MKHRHLPNEENAFKNFHFQRQIRIPCLNTFYVFFYTFYYCLLVVSFPGYFFFFFQIFNCGISVFSIDFCRIVKV